MTGWSVATFVALLVLPWFSATEASHFRGGVIMFEPDPSNDTTMRFAFRMAFRRSYSPSYYCDQSIKDSGQLLGSGDYWNRKCTNYTANPLCYSTYVASTGFHCTDFSIVEDWSMGENNFTYTFPANVYNLWTVSYTGCCWISLTKGGNSGWILSTVVNLTRRADTGEINSSPITTNQAIVRLREGCAQSIRIPLEDPDGDLVRCRWSHYYESYRTRDSFAHATLDEATCTLTYHGGSGSAGTYAVALTLEDFPAGTTDFANAVPFSSVGLQFLVIISASHSGSCDSKPVFTGSTPQDGQCAEIQTGSAYTATIEVTHVDHSQQIVELTTSSPSGMYFSPLSRNGLVYSSNITWYPSQYQAGKQVYCFKAVDYSGIESETRCGTILVGLSYTPHVIPGSEQPRYPTSNSGPGFFWSSIRFDRPIKKPRSASYIRLVLRTTGHLIYKVNALSSHVSISYNQTVLYFAMPFAALSMTGSYAILIDPGAVVGLGCSYDGPPTPGVSSTSQWGFYVFGICNPGYYLAPPAFNYCTDVNECGAHPRSRRSNGWPPWALNSSTISPSSTYSAMNATTPPLPGSPSSTPDMNATTPPLLVPWECQSYMELTNGNRHVTYDYRGNGIAYCDSSLTPGWYRFTGAAGTQMPDSCANTPEYGCGTVAAGWLNGSHPNVSAGVVWYRVCYHFGSSCCSFGNHYIQVRNCSGFYVYNLVPTQYCYLRYCGMYGNESIVQSTSSSAITPTPSSSISPTSASSSVPWECQNYMQLTNGNRHVTYDSRSGTLNCDNYITPGWYRFTGAAGTQMPESCADAPANGCGTHAAGWLNGSHPDVADGAVTYQVCYHWVSLCCWRTNYIQVRNCSGFYVYNLGSTPACHLRYCGMYGNEGIGQSTSSSGSCDFDSGLCPGWSQSSNDSFDWTLKSGSTPSSSTGPSSDHGGSGNYMYIEASSGVNGDNAKLELTVPVSGSASCLTFYYHMYGANMGTLNVYNGNTLIFTKSGDQGNIWFQATMTLDLQENVTFEGVRGSSFRSDIAIDDVSITNGTCPAIIPTQSSSVSPSSASPSSASPSECSSYTYLEEANRGMNYSGSSSSAVCDTALSGWYRFFRAAGTQMPTSCIPKNHCGTHAPGWLNASHPSVADGAVSATVCFHWYSDCCHWSTFIRVRNCGGFYVYRFSGTPACQLRYCGNAGIAAPTSSPTVGQTPQECSSYAYLEEANRGMNYSESYPVLCDTALSGWYRFRGAAGTRMPTSCIPTYRCGTHAPGWLNGTHPSAADGAVNAQVCFHWSSDCCEWSTNILVRNCGGFYVYEFHGTANACSLRYCGNGGIAAPTPTPTPQVIAPTPSSSNFPSSSSSSDPNSFHLTGWSGSFSSPNHPYHYENRHYCTWLITVTTGFYVHLNFSYFDLEHGGSYCPYDYVEIFDGNSTSAPRIIKRCGNHAPWCVHSSSNVLFVRFLTDGSVVRYGFFAHYETVYSRSGICHSATAATTYVTPMTSSEHGIHPTPSSSFYASSSINVQPPAEDFVLHLPADCAQMCSNTPGSFVCSCYNGFQLGSDGKTCLDINECRINNGGCSHHCINVPGSFYCDCPEGVTMAADNRSCVEPGVAVTCSDTSMTVSMEQRSFPFISIGNLNLRDPLCQAYDNGTHFILTTPLNGCGTTHNESQDALFFWNAVVANAVNIGNRGITRTHNFRLPFYCQYSRQKMLSLSFTPLNNVPHTEPGYGDLTFKLELYRSSSFSVPYNQNEFPIVKTLGENLYMMISVESSASLTVMAINMTATKDLSPDSSPQYPIIENGCSLDSAMDFQYNATSNLQQFILPAFRFLDDYDTVYIHVGAVACHAGSANSRCAQSCPINGGRKRRAALQDEKKESTDKVWISGGPLIIKDVSKESGDSGQSSGQAALIGGVGAAGGLFVLAVVALVVLAVKYRIARLFMNRNKVGDLYTSQDENMSRRNAYVEPEDMMEKEDVL